MFDEDISCCDFSCEGICRYAWMVEFGAAVWVIHLGMLLLPNYRQSRGCGLVFLTALMDECEKYCKTTLLLQVEKFITF